MYENIKELKPVEFVWRYVLSNYKGKFSKNSLYRDVCDRLLKNKNPQEFFDFVKELNSASTIYKQIFEYSFHSEKINKKLKKLHLIEVSPSFTLLLKILPYFNNNEITEEDVLEIMNMIEILHIRWGICNQATSRLDPIYNTICAELKDKDPKEFK